MEETPPRKRGQGRRTDIPWADIRTAYESGEETGFEALGRKFGVDGRTVSRRSKSEKWVVIADEMQRRTHSNVIDLATRKAVEQLGGDAGIEAQAHSIVENLRRHAEIETLLLDVAKVSLEEAKSGKFTMVSDRVTTAEARERAVNAAAKAIDKSREIHGLTAGRPSIEQGDDAPKKAERLLLIVREPQKESA